MKKFFLKLGTVLACALLALGFSACKDKHTHSFTNYISDNNATYEQDGTKTAVCDHDGCEETDSITDTGTMLESTITFNTLTVDGTEAYGKVSNETTEFSFLEEIAVNGEIEYIVCQDTNGSNAYFTKTVPLKEGDNTFYVFAMQGKDIKNTYTVTIRRRPNYQVSFNTNGGAAVASQTVEEGNLATKPNDLEKTGYTFIGWDYDFTQPITRNITISAKWEATYFLTFNHTITGLTEYGKTLSSIEIPEEINGETILSIGERAFYDNKNLQSVAIPNSVTSIGESAFYGCSNLKSVVIPNSVTSIGNTAFYNCDNLQSVGMPDNITSIGAYAFSDCHNLQSVVIPNSVTSVGAYAFYGCDNLQYTEKGGAKYLGNETNPYVYLAQAGLKDITSVAIENGCKFIGESAFYNCDNLQSVVIPNSVTSIGNTAFYDCNNLQSVAMPDNITSIGEGAFAYCSNLQSIVIPNSVTSIGRQAFQACDNLQYTEKGGAKYLGNETNPYVYLEKASSEDIASVTIENSCKFIGHSAFIKCVNLQSVVIPNSVINIGNLAFSNCSKLTEITVGENNTAYKSVDGNLYSKDGKILLQYAPGKTATSYTVPDGVTSIGESAFEECDNLQSIVIANSVTSIADYAFAACNNLQSVVMANSVTSIGVYVFANCSSLQSIIIPNSVTSIGYWVFDGCENLTVYCEVESQPSSWDNQWNYSNCPVYWYSENEPTADGNYWHYKNGVPTIWE